MMNNIYYVVFTILEIMCELGAADLGFLSIKNLIDGDLIFCAVLMALVGVCVILISVLNVAKKYFCEE